MVEENNIQANEHNKYMERFYNPEVSAYDFLSLFSAIYALQNEFSFNRDNLINFIHFCKSNSKYKNLLTDINIKSNGISYYSEEFDEAIGKLKWGRILYTISPEQDARIFIFKDIPTKELIEPRKQYLEELNCFIVEYKEFKKKSIKNKEEQEKIEAIKNHYTNLDIEDLPLTTYREPIFFGNFKNSDGSVNSAYLILKDELPTYVILSEEEHRVKAEISKMENSEDMDEFVYMTLQDMNKTLEEKINIIQSEINVGLSRKLQISNENSEIC